MRDSDSTWRLGNATCDGQVDTSVHGAWLLVTGFLFRLQNHQPFPTELIAADWLRTEEFKLAKARISSLNFANYGMFGHEGRCVSVASAPSQTQKYVELEAGPSCYLDIEAWTAIRFRVVRKAASGKPIIGEFQFGKWQP